MPGAFKRSHQPTRCTFGVEFSAAYTSLRLMRRLVIFCCQIYTSCNWQSHNTAASCYTDYGQYSASFWVIQCIVIGPVCGFVCVFVGVFVCLWVCYYDNSKLRASILTKLGL